VQVLNQMQNKSTSGSTITYQQQGNNTITPHYSAIKLIAGIN